MSALSDLVEADVGRNRLLDRVDIATARVLDPSRPPDPLGLHQLRLLFEQPFERRLGLVGQLEPVGTEQLDAIVFERIVAGRDHHAQIGAHLARQQRDGGGGQRAGHDHIHAHAGEARHQRAFHHVSGQARVFADHHPMAMVAAQEMRARRLPDAHRRDSGHDSAVGASANSVRPEELARHRSMNSLVSRSQCRECANNKRPFAPLFARNIAAMCNHALVGALGTQVRNLFTPTQEGTFHGF